MSMSDMDRRQVERIGNPRIREAMLRLDLAPGEIMDAVSENRPRIVRRLRDLHCEWAVDEVMANLMEETLLALPRYAAYEHRGRLAAFVNQLAADKVAEWIATDRPKHRTGMTYAPRVRRSNRPADPGDADAQRAWLRSLDQASISDPDDIFGSPDDTVMSASAGDRISRDRWLLEERGDGDDRSDRYRGDMAAFRTLVKLEHGADAWRRLVRRCVSDPKAGPILKEIMHWLESHHQGLDPSLADYPYILRAAGAGKERT